MKGKDLKDKLEPLNDDADNDPNYINILKWLNGEYLRRQTGEDKGEDTMTTPTSTLWLTLRMTSLQTCMVKWNDKQLYELPSVYVETQSNTCRLLNVPDFVVATCGQWIDPSFVDAKLKDIFTPKSLSTFSLVDNFLTFQ